MLTNALLHQSFKASPLASLLLKADSPNFIIQDVNDAFLEVSNTTSASLLIGKSIFEAFPENPNDKDENGLSKLKRSLCKVVETGFTQEIETLRYDIEEATTNRFVVKYWSVKNIPLLNEDGLVGYILHTKTDVTDSILAQQKKDALLTTINVQEDCLSNIETSNAIGSWDLDLETEDFYWSPEFFEICGYAPNAFTPSLNKALEIIHPSDHETVIEAFNNALVKALPYRIEHRIITATNQIITVLATGIIIKNKDGKHCRLTGIFQNITSQKQKDILLAKTLEVVTDSEKKYKQLFENNPSPMFIWDFKTLEIIDCNNEALLLYGYTKAEFLRLTIKDLRPVEYQYQINDINFSEENYQKTGKKVWLQCKKDGSILHVFIVGHLIEYKGRKASLVSLNDVTEKIKIEQALTESEIRFRSLFYNSTDGHFISKENGNIIAANAVACKMYGYTEAEFCKISRKELADITDERLQKLLRDKKETGHGEGIHRHFRKDGSKFEAFVSSTEFKDSNDEIQNSVIVKDITEKIEAENALKESEVKYRSLFQNAMDATLYTEPSGKILEANAAACNMFKMSEAEICEIGRSGIIDVTDERLAQFLAERTKNRNVRNNLRNKRKNGELFETETSSTLYNDINGIQRCIVTIKDITETLKAEQAIKESEARYKSFFNNSLDANLLSIENGNIIAANEVACKMFGYTEEEFCNISRKDIADLTDERLQQLLIDKKQTGHGEAIHRYFKKDGSAFEAFVSSTEYKDSDGNIRNAVIIKDINEKLLAEQALKESEARYKSFFENGINAHFIGKANGEIITANQVASIMFGYSIAELCQMNRAQLADMTDPRFLKLIRDKEVNGNAAGIHRFFHKNGQAFDGFVRSITYLDTNGEELSAITIKDLSEQIRVEKALAESEKKYRLLFYQSPIPKWIFEIGTYKIIDVNEAAIEHYGYSREEFLNLTIIDLRPAEEVHKLIAVNETDRTTKANGLYKAGKFIHKKKNGHAITVDISTMSIEYEDKKCKLVIANDVTDVEYALKELAISNERFYYATKATSDAIWDWDLEKDKILLGDGFINTFGYPLNNMVASISFLLNNVHPDDTKKVTDTFYRIVKSKDTLFRDEFKFKKADGSYAYVVNRGVVIRNEQGRTIRIVGGMRDITKYKNELLRLRLLETVITNTAEIIIITEAETVNGWDPKIVYVNEAFTKKTGYTSEEAVGNTPSMLQGPKTDRKELDRLRASLQKWEPCTITVVNYTKDGEEFWNNISVSPVADATGWFTHWVAIESDVTEKMQFQTAMIKSIIKTQEEERVEIGGELHDNICQILTSCKIAFKMVEKNINAADKIWFEQGIEQINMVFKEVRNLSHRLAPAFFKDGTLEESLTNLVRTFNIEEHYSIVMQFDDSFKTYASSREFLLNIYRILQEQLRNILKYAEAKNIIISGSTTAESLKLMIQDDGVGFNPQTQKNGIGLANIKRRAELFDGKLIIDSELGKGCTITVEIPLTEVR